MATPKKAPLVLPPEQMTEEIGDLLAKTNGIIVHGCNCQGVMGSGIALTIATKWPKVYENYRTLHEDYGLYLGDIQICTPAHDPILADKYNSWSTTGLPSGVVVINAMTQFNYGTSVRQVDDDAVSACFAKIRMVARDLKKHVYFPLIGCGLGGGDWEQIGPRITQALGPDIKHTLVRLVAPVKKLTVVRNKEGVTSADRSIQVA